MTRVKILARKKYKEHLFEITKVLTSSGCECFQYRIDGVIRWYYKAYKYLEDGVSYVELKAPYGLSDSRYEEALSILMSLVRAV